MKVKMRTYYAGPSGSCGAGATIDLADAEARGLIAGGYATEVETATAPAPDVALEAAAEAAETADAPAPETAAAPAARPRGKRGR